MSEQEPTDVDRAKALRLAKMFDLRSFIGTLFVIFGTVVALEGATASAAEIAKASDMNVSLWSGLAMLVVGAGFIGWMLAKPPVLPAADTSAEPPDDDGEHGRR